MSFQSLTAATRALSPSFVPLSALENAVVDDPMTDDKYVTHSAHRHAALQGANSVGEVIEMIPHDFRHVLAGPLRAIAATANRLYSVQATLEKWRSHQTAGTVPPFLSQKAPEVQFTKGFEESATGISQREKLAEAHKAYLKATFDNLIRAKVDEELFLKGALTPEELFKALSPLVITRGGELGRTSKVPDIRLVKDKQEVEVVGWVENTAIEGISKMVLNDCVVYAYRVISIVEASVSMSTRKKAAKKAVHEAADVEMQDGSSGRTIQSSVDKAINAALK
ncbi:hypothetical protein HD554DRAFT_2034209, partial [Boletus coccyginus]